MRGYGLLSIAVIASVLTGAGCARNGQTDATARATSAAAADAPSRAPAPAPSYPDLAVVAERFYQQVEGNHWPFAYAMLAPRYRATLSREELEARYAGIRDLDVTLRQTNGTLVTARLVGVARDGRPGVRVDELMTLRWDGEQWMIDGLTRR